MSEERCPHCGIKLPIVRDAYCGTCGEPLDEPPEVPRTPEEQEAFRARVERDARQGVGFLLRFRRLHHWFLFPWGSPTGGRERAASGRGAGGTRQGAGESATSGPNR